MFELNKEIDITVVSNIGDEKRNAIIVDNFYKNPDEVREYALTSPRTSKKDNPELQSGLPGWRVFVDNKKVVENLRPIFERIRKLKFWRNPLKEDAWEHHWTTTGFLCNIMNAETRAIGGGIPHQDAAVDTNYGVVIYLNKPEECSGGTRLYSYCGQQSQTCANSQMSDLYTELSMQQWLKDHGTDKWNVELEFEMVYNRMIMYEADLLHAQWYAEDAFTNCDRIAQVLFL